jgi:hypothetical protein
MRKKRTDKVPAIQLCLFSETEMEAMTERVVLKPVSVFTADPAQIRWELEIAQSLRGKEGRQHRRLLTQRRQPVRIAARKPPDLFTKT